MNSTESFETYRPLLFSIAYRMLGSAMAGEDMVQETYLRYQAQPRESIRSLKAFLTTVVTRLCLNELERAHVQRETYLGPWLPEPVLTADGASSEPSAGAAMHETISLAFLVLLESLTPVERAVFLLREVFDYPYAEIAEIVGKEETACRQIFSRAKKHIAAHRPRFKPTPEQHREALARFVQAVGVGDLDGLTRMLSADVTMWADGGGKVRGAALRPLYGREPVARFILNSTRLPTESYSIEFAEVNGEPAALLRTGTPAQTDVQATQAERGREGKIFLVLAVGVEKQLINEIRLIANPDKLHALDKR